VFLSKSHSGYYYIWFKDERGKKCKVSTRTKLKGEAYEALANFKGLTKKEPKALGLKEFTSEFLSYASATYSIATVDMYRRTLSNFAGINGNYPLRKITARHIDEYKTNRLKCIKPVSVHIELRALKASFNTAKRWKLLSENPSEESPLPSVPEHAPVIFTLEDFQKLLKVIQETWLRDMTLLAVLTGMRRSELVNLRWANVDLERRVVQIESTATFKTKAGRRRTIPLSDAALIILRSRLGKSQLEYVFFDRGAKIASQHVTHLFKIYVRKANMVDQRLHFHSTRHTFASWLVQAGVSLYEVQKFLGHSSPLVTEVYAHLQPENRHSEVNKIPITLN
jgi:integrase